MESSKTQPNTPFSGTGNSIPSKPKRIDTGNKFTNFFVKHWKGITIISVLIVIVIIGWILIAAVGASAFSSKYPFDVANNFQDPLGALAWYFNVVFIDNFLGVPAILLSVLSFVGYMILKRGFVDSLIGAIKTAVGVLLLNIGSSWLSGIVSPVFTGIKALGTNVISLDPYTGWNSGLSFLGSFASNTYVSWISYALLIGFVVNLIVVALKRWTNCHAVMTTGHIMFQQSAVVVPMVYILFFQNFALNGGSVDSGVEAGTVLFAGIFLGAYWSVGTTATIKPTNIITENANFAIGHQQTLGISLAYRLGKFFRFTKKEVVSAETRKLSKKFKIFEDNIFVQALLIAVLFLILAIILQVAGGTGNTFEDIVKNASGYWPDGTIGSYWIVKIIFGALFTVAAILAIITGVRMFVTELQQSFQGISEKVIPGAVVAVDIAAVYGFRPNASTYGFIAGVIGQFIGVGIMIGISFATNDVVVVVPLFITLYFNSGAVGIYANEQGGWKASITLPMLYGLIEIIVISLALGQLNKAVDAAYASGAITGTDDNGNAVSPVSTGYNGMVDWNFFFGLPLIFAAMHPVAAYIILPLEIVALFLMIQFVDTGLPHEKVAPLKRLFMSKAKNNVRAKWVSKQLSKENE